MVDTAVHAQKTGQHITKIRSLRKNPHCISIGQLQFIPVYAPAWRASSSTGSNAESKPTAWLAGMRADMKVLPKVV